MKQLKDIYVDLFRKSNLPKYLHVLLLLSFTACIKSDPPNCVRFLLRVNVLGQDGEDITGLGEAGNVDLFIFDENYFYLDHIQVSSQDIKNQKELSFTYKSSGSTAWVVAWSNLKGAQSVLPTVFTRNTQIGQALVQLRRDASGFAINPNDLFAGIIQVCGQCSSGNVLPIERMTAFINLRATGVPNNLANQEFSFVLKGASQDAYNFLTNLTGNEITYKQIAKVEAKKQVASTSIGAAPFTVYPLNSDDRFVIEVYNGENLIGVADRDINGNYLVPQRGRTMNLLLDFSGGSSSLNVRVEVTNWEDFYQWVQW